MDSKRKQTMQKLISVVVLGSLFGCSGQDNIDQWALKERQKAQEHYRTASSQTTEAKDTVQPHFDFVLHPPSEVQPFSPKKLSLLYFPGNGNRKPGVLQGYDLKELQYVGYIETGGKSKGFVKAEDHVYPVTLGTFMGRNYGRVVKITPREIVVQETMENAEGVWEQTEVKIDLIRTNSANKQPSE